MADRQRIWVPLGPVRNGSEDDSDPPRASSVWMSPEDFNEEGFAAAGFNPAGYNQMRMEPGAAASAATEERNGSPYSSTTAVPTNVVPTNEDTSAAEPLNIELGNVHFAMTDNFVTGNVNARNAEASNANQYNNNADHQLIPYHANQVIQYGAPAVNYVGNAPVRTFQPMHATMQPRQQAAPLYLPQPSYLGSVGDEMALVPYGAALRIASGFSLNYQGNISLDANRSADIPDHENCSLFVTGLAPNVSVTTLLRGIRNVGRIYAVHINAPEPVRGHITSAAKVTFFDRPSADRFFRRHALYGLHLPDHPGYVGRVVWNRIRTAAVDKPHRHTRVLFVAGPPNIATPWALHRFFQNKFVFDIDEIFDHGLDPYNRNVCEFRFSSYRCQAETGRMALMRELPHLVEVWYGPDPCDL